MAKIQLSESNGAYISKAASNVLLKVVVATYDQDFGKVACDLINDKGEIVSNNFGLMRDDGSINDGALKAFSYFSRVVMGDWGRDDIEAEDLVGRCIRADINMVEGKKMNKDGEPMYFANIEKCYMTEDILEITKKKPAQAVASVKSKKKPAPAVEDDEDDDADWE